MDPLSPHLRPTGPARGLLVVPVYLPSPRWEEFLPALIGAIDAARLPLVVRVIGDGNNAAMRARIDEAVEAARQKWPGLLRPTRHRDGNAGKGASVYFGWEGAEVEWLGFVDSDYAVDPREAVRLAGLALAQPSANAAVIAVRRPGATTPVERRLSRLVLANCFRWLVRLATGLPLHDTQCGLKWVPRSAYLAVRSNLEESRFVFDVELLARLIQAGVPVREEPIAWKEVDHSTIRWWLDGPAMLWGLLRVTLRTRRRSHGSGTGVG